MVGLNRERVEALNPPSRSERPQNPRHGATPSEPIARGRCSPGMTIRRVVLALVLALLALGTAGPFPAYAGGLTSVLMTNPTSQRPTAAYDNDMAVLADLYDAVGYTSRGSLRQPASVSDGGTPEVLLIWLAHGRSIGQVDRVLLTQDDGIWIQTIPSWNEGGAPNTDQRGRWRRPADAESLTAALTKAGMLGGGAPTGSAPTSSAPSASVPSASAVPAPSEVSAATGLPTFAVAALAGLAGLVLGGALVGVRGARRRDLSAGPAPDAA
jgi:hypothetical protein